MLLVDSVCDVTFCFGSTAVPTFTFFRGFAIAILICFLFLAIWIVHYRDEDCVKASQLEFTSQIIIGFILEVFAIFPLTVQDYYSGDEPSSVSQSELNSGWFLFFRVRDPFVAD
jgi:uncharacterized membrane protein YfhO